MKSNIDICIYGLLDPDGELRYIGKSRNPELRLARHTNNYKGRPVYEWIRSLSKHGQRPELIIIDVVPIFRWREVETYWIREFRNLGARLLNRAGGGSGGELGSANNNSKLTERDVAEIKSRICNDERLVDIASKFGVGIAAIRRIKIGENWTDVPWPREYTNRGYARGARQGHAKLKESDIPDIKRRLANKEKQTDIAAFYGVQQMAISDINTGKTWRHVDQITMGWG